GQYRTKKAPPKQQQKQQKPVDEAELEAAEGSAPEGTAFHHVSGLASWRIRSIPGLVGGGIGATGAGRRIRASRRECPARVLLRSTAR
ncbi:hypothetical protein ACWCRC_37095, partial [Streptomyces sp. NPDC001940]